MSSSSFGKGFAIIAFLLFLLLSTGFSSEFRQSTSMEDSFAPAASLFEESEGKSREMIELDYEDAGPNTNKRSGFILPDPETPTPAPQP